MKLNQLAEESQDMKVIHLSRHFGHPGFFDVVGIDVSSSAINTCKKRGLKNVFTVNGEKTFFQDNTFDLIMASDVLEHIQNDEQALSEWYRVLKTNGLFINFVPAFNFLWTDHDVINYHFRRYSMSDLKRKCANAKFKIIRSSYWNVSLFFPIAFIRLL